MLKKKNYFESMTHCACSIRTREGNNKHILCKYFSNATPPKPGRPKKKIISGEPLHTSGNKKKILKKKTPLSSCTSNLHSGFALQGDLMSQNKAF